MKKNIKNTTLALFFILIFACSEPLLFSSFVNIKSFSIFNIVLKNTGENTQLSGNRAGVLFICENSSEGFNFSGKSSKKTAKVSRILFFAFKFSLFFLISSFITLCCSFNFSYMICFSRYLLVPCSTHAPPDSSY